MRGFAALLYATVCYLVFLLTLLYAIGFVGDIGVPKSIDSGTMDSPVASLAIDLLLLGLFAVQHSVMARPAFKRQWTRLVPPVAERSTYVLMASAALIVLFWQWRPLTAVIWTVQAPLGHRLLVAGFWLGWGAVVASTFVIDHFELFGLRQAVMFALGRASAPPRFEVRSIYRLVRHPIYAGFLLAFWSTPAMSAGHLVFAVMTTAYILVGIAFEERDLIAAFGGRYRRYRGEVRMLLPLPKRRTATGLRAARR